MDPPMTLASHTYPNSYKDSVSLMTVSAQVMAVPGIDAASAVMASSTNVVNLAQVGLGDFEVRPNDLVVAVSGTETACAEALAKADELLSASPSHRDGDEHVEAAPLTSIQMAVARDPGNNLALISVPGDYAAAEAMKALQLGMDVMLFSDNVSARDELTLKTFARQQDLMVMGPDCGTAIVNGVPLGFANVVRRGRIGVVGASGTGTQEVTVRVHQLGSGISQALGTGGHDLSATIGGISMLHGMKALAQDPDTEVIALVSKPPAPEVATAILQTAQDIPKPVVVIFLGVDPATIDGDGVHGASTLAGAADIAVALAEGEERAPGGDAIAPADQDRLVHLCRSMAASQRYVRGIFSGGTFCFEAQLIHGSEGIWCFSNTPTAGNKPLDDARTSREHTIIDMGDDAFTQGRPHPMIDPTQRDQRIRDEVADPETAVVLFDVVLGYGSALDPVSGLIGALDAAQAASRAEGRQVAFIGYVCGTDQDPQDRARTIADLEEAGVLVASTNAQAAAWSAAIAVRRQEMQT
jgi:succinyl-CoA synthetase alpha subunit